MSSKQDLNDDSYVAKLLAEDAKKSSVRYASLGLSALLPKRPTNAAPKPNTRFLKSIIRETDTHNAALKKKEELEARIRLRRLREEERGSGSSRGYDDERNTKRRRVSDQDRDRPGRHQRRDEGRLRNSSSERSTSAGRRHSRSIRSGRDYSASREENDRYKREKDGRSGRRSGSPRRHRSRDRSYDENAYRSSRKRRRTSYSRPHPDSSDFDGERIGKKARSQRSERRKSRSISRDRKEKKDKEKRRRSITPAEVVPEEKSTLRPSSRSSSSDPLEEIVGPLPAGKKHESADSPPPVRPRGRGAYRSSGAAMDARFSSSYDPKLDLHPESEAEEEKEDWDMALEALRDREMWKQKQSERLREAGFGDDEIKKWEDGGKEKGVDDVNWSAKGEAREWDAGKLARDEPEERPRKDFEEGWKRKGGGFLKTFREAIG